MDETSDFGVCNYCAIDIYHRERSSGEGNKQVARQAKLTALGFEERRRLAAWVDRLDDKELICLFCHHLFRYFDPMSRMAVRKERLGGTGFGSADQPEHWAWMERRRLLMDSDALSPKVMGWDQRFWAGSDQMR